MDTLRRDLPTIDDLFPDGVATATVSPERIVGELFEVEAAAVARAVPARRREFTAGRLCARQALARIGRHDTPIPRGADRRPVWPAGIVGSISHSEGLCGAAVARRSDVIGVGLDIEIADACPPRLARRVLTPNERETVRALEGGSDGGRWRTLIFSAKESVYKALSGVAPVEEFEDVEVLPRPDEGGFVAMVHAGRRLHGKFRHHGKWVLTGVVVPHIGFG